MSNLLPTGDLLDQLISTPVPTSPRNVYKDPRAGPPIDFKQFHEYLHCVDKRPAESQEAVRHRILKERKTCRSSSGESSSIEQPTVDENKVFETLDELKKNIQCDWGRRYDENQNFIGDPVTPTPGLCSHHILYAPKLPGEAWICAGCCKNVVETNDWGMRFGANGKLMDDADPFPPGRCGHFVKYPPKSVFEPSTCAGCWASLGMTMISDESTHATDGRKRGDGFGGKGFDKTYFAYRGRNETSRILHMAAAKGEAMVKKDTKWFQPLYGWRANARQLMIKKEEQQTRVTSAKMTPLISSIKQAIMQMQAYIETVTTQYPSIPRLLSAICSNDKDEHRRLTQYVNELEMSEDLSPHTPPMPKYSAVRKGLVRGPVLNLDIDTTVCMPVHTNTERDADVDKMLHIAVFDEFAQKLEQREEAEVLDKLKKRTRSMETPISPGDLSADLVVIYNSGYSDIDYICRYIARHGRYSTSIQTEFMMSYRAVCNVLNGVSTSELPDYARDRKQQLGFTLLQSDTLNKTIARVCQQYVLGKLQLLPTQGESIKEFDQRLVDEFLLNGPNAQGTPPPGHPMWGKIAEVCRLWCQESPDPCSSTTGP